MKNQPLLLPLAGLISGIFLAENLRSALISGILILLAVLAFLYFRNAKKRVLIPAFTYLLFCLMGALVFGRYNQFNPLPSSLMENELPLDLTIEKEYKPSEKYRKYKVQIKSIDGVNSSGTYALLYSSNELPEMYTGDRLQIESKILPTRPALNPHQFDYSNYLKRQKIRYTLFASELSGLEQRFSLQPQVNRFKKETNRKMIAAGYSERTAGLVSAMLLGDRTETDNAMEESFRKTGVVHILAISGLHVMMVFSIFMLLLYPLTKIRKGKHIRIFIGLIMIWAFAGFVGFKPPVFRSVLMITIYYMTVLLRRRPNVYHTLTLTALILLFLNPNSLFDVGFQLSFSAVFFIVYLNPVFQKIFKPKGKLQRVAVAFMAASIGAQLGTLPFSAHYFNQTSGLFLAGNLIMIPASYYIIVGGMISLALVWTGWTPHAWTILFDKMNTYVTAYIDHLSTFKPLVFEHISLSVVEVLLLILILLLLRPVFLHRKFKYIAALFAFLFVFQAQRLTHAYFLNKKEEIIVFHQSRSTIIGIRKGKQMDLFLSDPEDSVRIEKFIVRPYAISERIRKTAFYDLETVRTSYYIKSRHFVILGKKVLYISVPDESVFAEGVVLIRDNAYLPGKFNADNALLITDGSNYPDFNPGSEELEIWRTADKGAKIIRSR